MITLNDYTDRNGTPVKAHVVTNETAGEDITVIGGSSVKTAVGMVVLETERPGVYDTVTASAWDDMGMTSAGEPEPVQGFTSPEPDVTGEDDETDG